jgi:hypothetical protein
MPKGGFCQIAPKGKLWLLCVEHGAPRNRKYTGVQKNCELCCTTVSKVWTVADGLHSTALWHGSATLDCWTAKYNLSFFAFHSINWDESGRVG